MVDRQHIQAINDRINGIRKEMHTAFSKALQANSLLRSPRPPNMIFVEWVIAELSIILLNQEQLTANWNVLQAKERAEGGMQQ